MLEVIGGGVGSRGLDPEKYVKLWMESRECAEEHQRIEDMVTSLERADEAGQPHEHAPLSERLRVTRCEQLRAVVSKAITQYWRKPSYNTFRVFLNIIVGLLVGAIFFDTFDAEEEWLDRYPWNYTKLIDEVTAKAPGINATHLYRQYNTLSQAKTMSGISVCFLSAVFCGVININTVLAVVMQERSVYYRERASQMYDAWSYSLGMWVAEVPYICVQGIVYVCIAYPMVAFPVNGSGDFATCILKFYFIFTLYLHMATYFGQLIACLVPTQDAATIVTGLINTIWNIFAGFLIAKDKIPVVYKFLYYLSPIRYALEPLITSQFYCDGCAKGANDLGDQIDAANERIDQLVSFVKHNNVTAIAKEFNVTLPTKALESLLAQADAFKQIPFPTIFTSTCNPHCEMVYITAAQGMSIPVFASDFATGQFGFEYNSFWTDAAIIATFAVCFRIMTTLTLKYVNHQKR